MKRALFLLINIILCLSRISYSQQAASYASTSYLIKANGSLWAWGNNSNGQIGDGTTINRKTPVEVLPSSQWISISSASSYGNGNITFGIKKNGTLWVWGVSNAPVCGIPNFYESKQTTPIQVGTDSNWKIIKTNGTFTVGLKNDGTIWQWGNNGNRELGDGTTVGKNIPTKIGTDSNWSSITSTQNITIALKQDGTLWVWGAYTFASNLAGSTDANSAPTQVGSDNDWKNIKAGQYHILALKHNGSLWSYGQNDTGQLGDGTNTNGTSLIRVGTDNDWINISANNASSFAIKSNGTLWAWGQNRNGQLAQNFNYNLTTPTQIGNETNWKSILGGYLTTIALKKDNSIWIWGDNNEGTLGLGLESFKKTPTQVSPGTTWKEISSSTGVTLGIKLDGTLWAWGDNSFSNFGNNNQLSTNVPIQIGTSNTWKSVVINLSTVAAIKTDGTLWTWTALNGNGFGTLGNGTSGRQTNMNIITRIGTDTNWDKIFSSGSNIFAIKSNGSLWGWGYNSANSINNLQYNVLIPTQIGSDLDWKSIGPGFSFTIGLKTNGTIWGWGDNFNHYLGLNSSTLNYTNPQQIGLLSNWTTISSSYESTIALNSSGNIYAWGYNRNGGLGFDPTIISVLNSPTQLTNFSNVKYISSGVYHSTAIKTDGTLWAWGSNYLGELGDGSTNNFYSGKKIGTDNNWDKVFSSGSHSTFAIKTDGSLWAWGDNTFGELGIGEFGYKTTPALLFATDNTSSLKIFVGGNSNFEIKADGSLWAWGNNSSGQLGIGHKNNQSYPIQVGSSTDWKYVVTANSMYTLALKNDGSLWGWGKNGTSGYLGIGDPTIEEFLIPTRIGSASDWAIISAGTEHNLAIKSNGTLWAWGNNLSGILGDGTSTIRTSPVQIGADLDWKFISSGKFSSYAIKSNGKLYSWGANSFGQLGDGSTISKNIPTIVGSSSDWMYVDAGAGNVLAIKENYSLWGWGMNTSGQLGNSTLTNVNLPQQIGTSLDWVSTNSSKTLPFTIAKKSNGTIWSTGINVVGALGLGNLDDKNIFSQIGSSSNWKDVGVGSGHVIAIDNNNILYAWGGNHVIGKVMNNPIKQIGSLSNWNNIISGSFFSATIKSDGSLWMWGQNTNGQLGDGTRINKDIPTQIGTSLNWKSISLGSSHTVGLKTDGSIWSWGTNSYGQLGDGTTTSQLTPIQIGSNLDWKSIFCGDSQTFAIKNDGSLWAWGMNIDGRLGDGTNSNRSTPTRIGTSNDWKEISSGLGYTIALKSNGTIWGWGNNYFGQLGDGTTANKSVPSQIGSSSSWKSVYTGNNHSAALQNDGSMWFWGNNLNGQLGNNSTTNSTIPIKIGNENNWSKLALGISHSIALKNDNTIWSWGSNSNGQLGDGTVITRTLPQKIGIENDWNQITAGGQTLAIKNDGTLWGSGGNTSGELGDGRAFFSTPSIMKPIIEITPSGKSTYCSSGSMTLTASEGLSYIWSTGALTRNITIGSSGGSYSVTVSYPNGDVITSDPILIPVSPNTTISTTGSMIVNRYEDLKSYKMTVPAGNGLTYQWYNNGVAIPGALTNAFVPKKNGAYSVIASNNLGCVSSSITKTVNFVLSDTLTYLKVVANSSSSFLIKPNGTLWVWGLNTSGQLGLGDKINRGYAVQVGTSADWKMVANAANFTIGLKKDGTLWGWGYNGGNGYLGLGNTNISESLIPTRIGTANDWSYIAVGNVFTIAQKTDGTIWGWGYNNEGQLGDQSNVIRSAPIQIGTDSDWSIIATGGYSSYAIKINGSLYAWGRNTSYQLGDGTNVHKNIPTRIGTSNDWGLINAGSNHVLSLKTDGSLWGWGINSSGQLGNSSTTSITTPTQIGSDLNWVNLFISSNSNSSFAIKSNGTLWSTGNNNYGQLGQNNITNQLIFSQIGSNTNWRSASIGSGHALALDNLNKLYSWGNNASGQLGNGKLNYNIQAKQVGADLNWDKITSGFYHSGGIKKDGTLWLWGRNTYGQIGDGTTNNKEVPTQIGNAKNWKSIALGYYHSVGIKTDGSLWSWGLNSSGQLGDGSGSNQFTPIQIGTSTDWKMVSAGTNFTIAIKNNGTIWAWGYNNYGQLGNGTTTNSSTPIQISAASDWSDVSAGYYHVVALKSNGTVWTWGANFSNQLGNSNTANSNLPIQLGTDTNWSSIRASLESSYASKNDKSEWAWGYNFEGQLGDGTTNDRGLPTQIPISNIQKWPNSISGYHNSIIKKDGSLWAWGSNFYGQLGDGTYTNKSTPSIIGDETDWNQTALGYGHTLATKTDGSLWSWGYNLYGQLGDGKAFYFTPTLAKPIVEITTSGRSKYCSTGSLTLIASEGLSYTWSTGATTRSITVNTGGNYNVTVRYPIGDIVTSDVLNIPTSPLPNVAMTTTGSTAVVNLTDTKTYALKVPVVTGAKYQWSKDGATISGATAAEYVPQENGTYKVNVTSPFGCVANSADKVVKFELADTDNDGITDNIDKCPNTTAGVSIDAYGCEIFNLPAKNYSVGMGSGTCAGAKNGSIQISFTDKNYNYTIKAIGANSGFTKDFTYKVGTTAALNINGLAKDTYNICITIDGKTGYEQCFDVIISEPEPLKTTSSFNPNSNTLVLDLSGSESYFVTINGNTEKVKATSFSKVLATGLNKISITTELGCQGKVEEEIFISEQAQAFPNPTSGPISIYVPGVDSSVRVAIQTLEKTILDESRELDHSRIIKYDLSKMDRGTYLIQVSGPHVNKTLKLIKQ